MPETGILIAAYPFDAEAVLLRGDGSMTARIEVRRGPSGKA
jgi:hypothetical protein